jgi:hypothetical protein
MSVLSSVAALVAAATPTPTQTVDPRVINDPESVSPGMLGLASMIFLCITVYLIWRGLNKQLKRVNFDDGDTRGPRRFQIPLMDDPDDVPPAGTTAEAPAAVDVAPPASTPA